jgi:hypothetical protein
MRVVAAFSAVVVTAFGISGALAGPAEQAQIKAGCAISTNWSEAACTWLSEQAGSLNDLQQGFLAATMNQKQAEAAQAALQMTAAETMEASMFMANAGPGCQ